MKLNMDGTDYITTVNGDVVTISDEGKRGVHARTDASPEPRSIWIIRNIHVCKVAPGSPLPIISVPVCVSRKCVQWLPTKLFRISLRYHRANSLATLAAFITTVRKPGFTFHYTWPSVVKLLRKFDLPVSCDVSEPFQFLSLNSCLHISV